MREFVIVTYWKRPELLHCCLDRIRASEPKIPVMVFPDRGSWKDKQVQEICQHFNAEIACVPDHDYYGNTYCTLEAYRFAFNAGFERVYLIESDVVIHSDFFPWHREQHEEWPDIFCSMAWIFNRHAPITDDVLFQCWFYSIGVCFARDKLALVVEHATPRYYDDMAGFIQKHFKGSPLNDPANIAHFEQDGLLQRILDQHKLQTVSPGIAKCSHMGFVRSYGDTGAAAGYESLFEGLRSFEERVERVEQLIADPYERMSYFGKEIVEREIGHAIQERSFRYRIKLPGGWESEFESPLDIKKLPKRLNSVPMPTDALIEKLG